jgi:hypothetical protein
VLQPPHHRPPPQRIVSERRNHCSHKPSTDFCNKSARKGHADPAARCFRCESASKAASISCSLPARNRCASRPCAPPAACTSLAPASAATLASLTRIRFWRPWRITSRPLVPPPQPPLSSPEYAACPGEISDPQRGGSPPIQSTLGPAARSRRPCNICFTPCNIMRSGWNRWNRLRRLRQD